MVLEFLPCLIPLGIILLIVFISSIKVIFEYERAVLFTFGQYRRILGPGLNIIIPIMQSVIKVDTRIQTVDIAKQEVITKDNVPVSVNAVVYMKVESPEKAVLKIQNYVFAVAQYGQTALRDVIGNKDLDFVLTERDQIASEIKDLVDRETSEWGVDITSIKIQDIELPADMKRIMARQAEAEREKRAAIIKSEGEVMASQNIKKAATTLSQAPGALHLRTLETLSDISSDPSNKIVLAVPIEVLRAIQSFAKEDKSEKS